MRNKKVTFSVLLFSTLIFGLHYIINVYLLSQPIELTILLKINIFITLLTLVVLNSLRAIKIRFPNKVGFGYLAFVLIKMIISVVFLFPFLKEKTANLKVIILTFFLIFFTHLIFEVYLIIKSLKNDENH